MSGWDAYISNLMQSSDAIKRAAIVSNSDGSVWARSAPPAGQDFAASAEELKKFVMLFSHLNDVPATGFDLEGIHYIVPRTEENLIFGKKEKTGVFAVKTNMTVLIACYDGETDKGQECRTAVEKMGEYLKSLNY